MLTKESQRRYDTYPLIGAEVGYFGMAIAYELLALSAGLEREILFSTTLVSGIMGVMPGMVSGWIVAYNCERREK